MSTNPRIVKKIKEIDSQIAKLEAEKSQMINWRSEYEDFHLNRIEDIIYRGTVKTQCNSESTDMLKLEDTHEKLDFLISSLFEMGIIEDFEVHNKIQKGLRDFFNSE
jgi:hypothetical protein